MIPMDFTATLSALYTPLSVFVEDAEGSYDSPGRPGEWVWEEPVRRLDANGKDLNLRAIVLALSPQTLFFYNEGNVSDGGIAVITQTPLYFTNIHSVEPCELNKQSFVGYQNIRFRVVGSGFISGWNSLNGNANFKCYHCLRHLQ